MSATVKMGRPATNRKRLKMMLPVFPGTDLRGHVSADHVKILMSIDYSHLRAAPAGLPMHPITWEEWSCWQSAVC